MITSDARNPDELAGSTMVMDVGQVQRKNDQLIRENKTLKQQYFQLKREAESALEQAKKDRELLLKLQNDQLKKDADHRK